MNTLIRKQYDWPNGREELYDSKPIDKTKFKVDTDDLAEAVQAMLVDEDYDPQDAHIAVLRMDEVNGRLYDDTGDTTGSPTVYMFR